MSKMTPEVIAYIHVDNMRNGKENMKSMGKAKFGERWIGFVKEMTYVHSEGYITKKLSPIDGPPVSAFRKAIEDAGLVGLKF